MKKYLNIKLLSKASLFVIVSLLVNCQKDDINTTSNELLIKSPPNFTATITKNNSLINNNSALKKVLKEFSVNSSNRTITSTSYNFSIDTTTIQLIETATYKSYTFTVKRDSYNPDILENYVFTQYNDSTYTQLLIAFPIIVGESDISYDINNSLVEIINDNGLIYSREETCASLMEYVEPVCTDYNCGYFVGGNGLHSPGEICEDNIVRAQTICTQGGWVDTGCPDTNGSTNTTNSNNNTNGGGNNNNNTTNDNEEDVVIIPLDDYINNIDDCINGPVAFGETDNTTININLLYSLTGKQILSINNYLQLNGCSDQTQEFIILAIKAMDNDGIDDGEVDLVNAIILDESVQNNQKVKCVYNKLKTLSNTIFKDIIDSHFGSSNTNHVKITIGNLPVQLSSGTIAYTYTTYDSNSSDPLNSGAVKHIRIDPTFVQNGSTIEIALVLIHEFIHAELIDRGIKLGFVKSQNTLGATILTNNPNTIYTIQNQIFNLLLTQYNAFPPNANFQWQHDLFNALSYRTKMAQNLISVHSLLNDLNNDFLTNVNNDPSIVGGPYTIVDLMEYISWIGLEQTQDYAINISNIPSELAKKQYVENVANTKYTHNCSN